MLRILLGYLAALAAPAVVIATSLNKGPFVTEFLAAMVLELIFSILPFVACTTIAHVYRIRNPIYYVAWSLVPILIISLIFGFSGQVLNVLMVPAVLGGFLYWLISGRVAGQAVAA